MKDVLYITLKVQAAQNFSIQNDLKNQKKTFFKINGPAKTKATRPLLPALLKISGSYN